MDTEKKSKKTWSKQDTDTVAFHSKGIVAKDACVVLEKIILDRSTDAIMNKIYQVQALERKNALEDYRAAETSGHYQKANEETAFTSEEVLAEPVHEAEVAIQAVKERIKNAHEPLFCAKIIPESITEEVIEEEDTSVLKYQDKTILVSNGTIKVPFVGEIECDFEITGTFSIRKVGKKTLI